MDTDPFFRWADLVDDRGVVNLLTPASRDVIVVDNEEGIRPLDALSCALCVTSYPLEEACHLIGVRRGPGGGVIGVLMELVILHEFACLFIEYCQRHDTGYGCV